ncbi:MAG: CotH kinase family protein [Lachnospiraceae bacterium]
MIPNKNNTVKNRIATSILFVLLVGAILYCICYLKGSEEEYVEVGQYHVVIGGKEPEESAALDQAVQEDPYNEDYLPINVLAQSNDITREVKLYVSDGVCYAFLPAYIDLTQLICEFDDTLYKVSLSGRNLSTGEFLRNIEIGAEYEMDFEDGEQNRQHYMMVFLQSQNLPAVFIDTASGSMDYVDSVKGNEEPGEFICITADGETDSSCSMNWIRGRGNTSWGGIGEKNQYNVQLTQETDVLHMGSAQNWVLQSNREDVSMMRNMLAYDFAKDIGIPYAVDSRFVDMYINGEYMGTYQVIEKIEVGSDRVDINQDSGFIIEKDYREQEQEQSFKTKYGIFAISSPQELTVDTHDYIADYVNITAKSIDQAPYSDEYLDYIDINSFAKLFIMSEISNNPDANALSTFYYKEDQTERTKLIAGPVWDFDRAFANDERGADILHSNFSEEWFADLYHSKAFRTEVSGVLQDIMEETYVKYENDYFDGIQGYLEASYRMNEIRWKEKRGYIASIYPGYEENIGYLKNYLLTRVNNLNNVFNGSEKYHKVEFKIGAQQFAHTYVTEGSVVPKTTVQAIENYYGVGEWYLESGQEINLDTYQIFDDVTIKCQFRTDAEETEITVEVMAPEKIQTSRKGELAMQWISFIMLMVPGVIALWISGVKKICKENIFAALMQYLINSFMILLIAYGAFYILYGSAILSFSDVYDESYQFSIYNINVAFKYLLLAGGLAVVVGLVERLIGGIFRKEK